MSTILKYYISVERLFIAVLLTLAYAFRDRELFRMLVQLKSMVRNNSIMIRKIADRQNFASVPGDISEEFILPVASEEALKDVNILLKDNLKRKTLGSTK